MMMKEIRAITNLSQPAFAEKYHIPLDTLKGWEAEPGSRRYRQCPSYVEYLLERVVKIDYCTDTD